MGADRSCQDGASVQPGARRVTNQGGEPVIEDPAIGLRDDPVELDDGGDVVYLVVPPSSSFLRTLRLTAADAAERSGLDCEEVEDFRIAVDELCHGLMGTTEHRVAVSFRIGRGAVVARGTTRAHRSPERSLLTALSQTVVRASADHHEIEWDNDSVGFVVVKTSRAARRST
jgi:hypothetical protein